MLSMLVQSVLPFTWVCAAAHLMALLILPLFVPDFRRGAVEQAMAAQRFHRQHEPARCGASGRRRCLTPWPLPRLFAGPSIDVSNYEPA